MVTRQDTADRRGESSPEGDTTHQAALLIDFDNVTMGIRSNLGQELRNLLNSDVIRGKVAVQRAYADWRRYPQYIVPLSEASIDLIFAPAYGSSKKNATDIRLAIDALELVFVRPEIQSYILMSGDSDFSSLVLKLKEYGKYVIGVGIQESSSDLLVQNCDEYYSYTALSGLSKMGDQPAERHDPWALVEKAVDKMVSRNDTMRSDRLKQVMLEMDSTFNEKELGFNKFNRFVVEAASRGLVSIQKMENGQYGVAPPGKPVAGLKGRRREGKGEADTGRRGSQRGQEKQRGRQGKATAETEPPAKRDAKKGKSPETTGAERGRRTQRARPKLTMESALELLQGVLDTLLEDPGDSVRDSDVKRRMLERDPAFDEGELGYSKFSKFLQAAEKDGAIELTRGPNGNYHVSRPKPGARHRGKAGRKDKTTRKDQVTRKDKTTRKREPKREDATAAVGVQPQADTREPTMKRLARFLFGGRREEELGSLDNAADAEDSAAPRRGEPGREKKSAAVKRETESRGRPAREHERGGQRRRSPRAGPGPRGLQGGRERGRREDSAREGRGRQGRRGRREEPRVSETREKRDRAPSEAVERAAAAAEPDVAGPTRKAEGGRVPQVETGTGSRSMVGAEPKEPPETEAKEVERAAASSREKTDQKEPAVKPAPMPGAPRGTIRGRWGSRGRYRPSEAPPPIMHGQRQPGGTEGPAESVVGEQAPGGERDGGPQAEEASGQGFSRGDDTSHDSGRDVSSIVSRLTRYPGVGRKTAETLVEAFGDDTLRVLDEAPERVRELLPDHRAERVLTARREERTGAQG